MDILICIFSFNAFSAASRVLYTSDNIVFSDSISSLDNKITLADGKISAIELDIENIQAGKITINGKEFVEFDPDVVEYRYNLVTTEDTFTIDAMQEDVLSTISGTSLLTVEPAAMIARSPTVTGATIFEPEPMNTSLPIVERNLFFPS